MKDPAVLRQRAKVELLADPRIDAVRPRREGIVELTLADGSAAERVDQATCAARPRIRCRATRSSPRRAT